MSCNGWIFSSVSSGPKLSPNPYSEILPLLLTCLLAEHGNSIISRLASVFISLATTEVELLGTNAFMNTHVAWQLSGECSDDPECAHMNFLKD